MVERARRALALEPPRIRRRTVERLDYPEVEQLIRSAYRDRSAYGVMIKTLFLTGARVNEFVHIRVEDLHLDDESPQIYLTHAKRQVSDAELFANRSALFTNGGEFRYAPL